MLNKIICLVGESGSGKTTIAELLEKEGVKNIQSFTTRKPRHEGETGHIFTTLKQYEVNKANNSIVAETLFDGNRYWTTKGQLNGTCVYVIDPVGVIILKERVKDSKIIVIYLRSEQHTRWNRMCWRKHKSTDVADFDILERLKHDKEAFKFIECDYVIDADRGKEEVLKDVKDIIGAYEP